MAGLESIVRIEPTEEFKELLEGTLKKLEEARSAFSEDRIRQIVREEIEENQKMDTFNTANTVQVETTMLPLRPVPSVGHIVHYVLTGGRSEGEHRPAIIVRIWPVYNGIEMVQLQVFTDNTNDYAKDNPASGGIMWATSVHQDEENKVPGTWHWPEFAPAK